MDLLKKHYEKVLLGVVLVGLAVGAALLPWMIASERKQLQEKADEIIRRPPKPLPDLDLSATTNLFQRVSTPVVLDLSTGSKLLNPSTPWQRRPDGGIAPVTAGRGVGPEAVVVTRITPLYTTFTLESVNVLEAGARYIIGIVREAAAKPADRRKRTIGAGLNENTKEGFILREVRGPANDPTELVLELTDTGERVTLSKTKPYRRVDGYTADVRYPPENRNYAGQRVGARLRLSGEDYNVVAITANEVVVSAPSGKKTSRPFNPEL